MQFKNWRIWHRRYVSSIHILRIGIVFDLATWMTVKIKDNVYIPVKQVVLPWRRQRKQDA